MNHRASCLVFGLALMFAAATFAQGPQKNTHRITILHTNDLHGHLLPWRGWEGALAGKTIGGMDRVATVVKQVRTAVGVDKVLLLDAGDTFADSLIAHHTQGEAIVKVMNAIGYDAMVIGNHEPDFSTEVLRTRMGEARFPILAANIVDDKTGQLFAKPYLVKNVGALKVGILGIAYPNTALTTAAKNVQGLRFLGAVETVRRYLPRMRKDGAQLIVVLSHYGLGADQKLAQSVPGIDIIVGGHSHNRMERVQREGDTIIVQAGAHGSDVGRLDLTVRDGKIVDYQRSLILLDNDQVDADPDVRRVIADQVDRVRHLLGEKIADATTPIVRAQTLAGQEARKRDAFSPADALFADILREEMGVDIALLPGVGYGVAIPPGPIRAVDLRNLIPHDSKVVTMRLTGKAIREVVEQSIENTLTDDPQVKVGGMIQVSGLSFSYDPRAAFPDRVIEIDVDGAPLDESREYSVVTNSLLAGGGHRYVPLTRGTDRRERQQQYELIKRALAERKIIVRPAEGRIQSEVPQNANGF